MIKQFLQNQKHQYKERQPRHNTRLNNQLSKQTQWNMKGLSVLKRSPCISLNKSAHRRKISLSNIKKLKESKNSYPVERRFDEKKKLFSQNNYPAYQYNYSRIPILKNMIPILEEKLIFSERSPQPFQVSNGKQINQNLKNLTYCRNTIQQKSAYFSQNYLHAFQRIKNTEQTSPLTFKQTKPKQKQFDFSQTNRNQELVNYQIKSSIKQKQLSAEITKNNICKKIQNEVKFKTQQQQIGFRRTQSFGSEDNQEDNDISIVLEHLPIEWTEQNKTIQLSQTKSHNFKEPSFNKFEQSRYHR